MKENGLNYGCSAITTILAAVQANEVYSIVMMILGVISFIVSLSYTIYKFYHTVKKNGGVTKEAVDELKEETENHIEELKENLKEKEK